MPKIWELGLNSFEETEFHFWSIQYTWSGLKNSLVFFSGTLTVEEVYKDRDQFASLVREVAAPDVGRMGIEVLSFTIKDVYDNVTYLASLGTYT